LAWRRFAPPFSGYVWIATGIIDVSSVVAFLFVVFQADTLTKLLGKYPSCCSTASSTDVDVEVDEDNGESMAEECSNDDGNNDDEVENPYIG
jgi:hypothetical protein